MEYTIKETNNKKLLGELISTKTIDILPEICRVIFQDFGQQ